MTTQDYSRFGPYAGAMAAVTSPDIDKTMDNIREALIASSRSVDIVGFPNEEQLQSFIMRECKQHSFLPPVTRTRFEPRIIGDQIVAWNMVNSLHYP